MWLDFVIQWYFRNNVSESESNICILLGHAVNISSELARSKFEPGNTLDHLMKLITRLYSTVGLLAKYFFVKCKSSRHSVRISRFDKLVHLIGNTMTQNVYNLITYVQVIQFSAFRNLDIETLLDSSLSPPKYLC